MYPACTKWSPTDIGNRAIFGASGPQIQYHVQEHFELSIRRLLDMMKTLREINEKICNSSAIVMNAAEMNQKVRDCEMLTARDVDVVTTGTFGVISSTF